MFKFTTGILDKTRFASNVLMLILLVGNIFFSIQYNENIKQQAIDKIAADAQSQAVASHIQVSRFLKEFIDVVLNTKGTIAYADRVKLENDVQQLNDADILKLWNAFVASSDAKSAQDNTVKLMSLLANKML
ncbi:MAG: hypothetical protein PHF79_03315 [Candidatus Pacebacteria bacterium]|nr:hypothetical protein [Candidatus Paceibacterota bacterium]